VLVQGLVVRAAVSKVLSSQVWYRAAIQFDAALSGPGGKGPW